MSLWVIWRSCIFTARWNRSGRRSTMPTAISFRQRHSPLIKDPAKLSRVGEVLHHLLEVVRTLARVLAPFMPETALRLRELLAIDEQALKAPWGEGFVAGHKINPPKVLFPRIETDGKK